MKRGFLCILVLAYIGSTGIPWAKADSLPPSQLVFLQNPTDTSPFVIIFPAVQVAVEDASGKVVTSATDDIVLSLAVPSAATLAGATVQPTVNGIATFLGLALDTPGSYELTASSFLLGLPSSISRPFIVSVPPVTPVPEPGTAVLLGTGLLGLIGAVQRKCRKKSSAERHAGFYPRS